LKKSIYFINFHELNLFNFSLMPSLYLDLKRNGVEFVAEEKVNKKKKASNNVNLNFDNVKDKNFYIKNIISTQT
jgi:hypothetical protein